MSRVAQKRIARRGGVLKSILSILYLVLVVISAIIVGGYLIWNLTITAPEIPTSQITTPTVTTPAVTTPTVSTPTDDQDEAETLPVLQRKEGFYTFLLVGCDDGNGNADTMMVVGYDVTAGTVNLVSVPRDTIVERSWTSFPKLNSAFGYGGVDLVREEISDMLGIPLDYYVMVDLTAFEKLVDALGGLDFYVPQDMYHDDEAGFIIDLKEGQQHLSGYETLQLVRYRGYQNADIGRTDMQQQVLTALAKQALSWNSITKLNSFVEIFDSYVDTDLTLNNMLYFAQSALSIDMSNNVTSQTLEGRGDCYKNGSSWCYELDADLALEVVNSCLNPYTTNLDERYLNLGTADSYMY